MVTKLVLITAIISLLIISTVGITLGPTELNSDPSDLHSASFDFGLMSQAEPLAVLRPGSTKAVAGLVRAAYGSSQWIPVSARGRGHSTNGQAHARNGVVIEMTRDTNKPLDKAAAPEQPKVNVAKMYVDTWGGELWVDVLRSTLEYGLAPKTWTDYLYLTVGGTLSNAGISGQTFYHGPQISNVMQLQVVTGKGEIINCSEKKDSKLFNAVLGGLGQFGIITKARIALEQAPQMVRWMRVLYSNFTEFTRDQEYLISLQGKVASERFDYVEGFVIVDEASIDEWRSSFSSPQNNPVNISPLQDSNGPRSVLYCLEITKNYFDSTPIQVVDQEVDALLKKLDFISSTVFTTDLPYVDFLDRVHKLELELQPKGLWEVPHPWLNLFVPKSKIAEFDRGVFKGILGNKTSGTILIYPMNNNKWDSGTSAVTPNEDVFYLVGLLRSALEGGDEALSLKYLSDENNRILKFCKEANIQAKQYLPHYTLQDEWMQHFGQKWNEFYRMKTRFDPRHILASGQRIFEPNLGPINGKLLR